MLWRWSKSVIKNGIKNEVIKWAWFFRQMPHASNWCLQVTTIHVALFLCTLTSCIIKDVVKEIKKRNQKMYMWYKFASKTWLFNHASSFFLDKILVVCTNLVSNLPMQFSITFKLKNEKKKCITIFHPSLVLYWVMLSINTDLQHLLSVDGKWRRSLSHHHHHHSLSLQQKKI